MVIVGIMELEIHSEIVLNCEIGDFIDAVDVWCIKPQVVNRRLAGSSKLLEEEFVLHTDDPETFINNLSKSLEDCVIKCSAAVYSTSSCAITHISEDVKTRKCSVLKSQCEIEVGSLQPVFQKVIHGGLLFTSEEDRNVNSRVVLRKLLPRNIERFAATFELLLIHTGLANVYSIFSPICVEGKSAILCDRSYYLKLDARNLRLQCYTCQDFNAAVVAPEALVVTRSWLTDTLIPKLKTWAESSFMSKKPLKKSQSLSLVDVEEYTHLYTKLKKKYGSFFIEIWPESTDPLKFVYEDIALATYLLLIWKQDRDREQSGKMQSFIDLGCGNGLLVHLLTMEGHRGRGIDISERKIWKLYGNSTILEKAVIYPNQFIVTEDWIIGNHSDELTPWIPVIASRSSYTTRYFVLPCCFHDFSTKFHRVDQTQPAYEAYLDYILNIGKDLGFVVEMDTLRIPSTKRICQIGYARTYKEENQFDIERIITNVFSARSFNITECNPERQKDVFKPRVVTNDPKNCSLVAWEIKTKIVMKVFEALLNSQTTFDEYCVDYINDEVSSKGVSWKDWQIGGFIHLNDLASLFDNSVLKELKCQCGGLQTMLKNNRHIFKVMKGMVCLRDYRNPDDLKPSRRTMLKSQESKNQIKDKYKTKLCWFYDHHPQGCVLSSEECKYAHGTADCVG